MSWSPASQNHRSVGALQLELARLNHYVGAIDGVLGPVTLAAIDDYHRANAAKPGGSASVTALDVRSTTSDDPGRRTRRFDGWTTARQRVRLAAKHPVAHNTAAQYIVAGATFVLPLLTLPFMARVLGPSGLGLVVLSQSFSFALGMLIEYGFALSASRDLARDRDDAALHPRIVSDVLGAKTILISLSTVVSAAAFFIAPPFRAHPVLLFLSWIYALGQGFDPTWYFLATERLRAPSAIELGQRLIATVLVLSTVHRGDTTLVVAIWTACSVGSTLALTLMMYRRVPIRFPRLAGSIHALRTGWPMFVAGLAQTLFTSANTVLLGAFSSSVQVAFFSSGEKIVRALIKMVGPIPTAVFPRVANLHGRGAVSRARMVARLTVVVMVSLGILIAVVAEVLAPAMIHVVYGPGYGAAVPVLRILIIIVPLTSVSMALGFQYLLPERRDRWLTRNAIGAGVLNVCLAFLLAPSHGAIGMAWALVATETFAMTAATLVVSVYRALEPGTPLFSRIPRFQLSRW